MLLRGSVAGLAAAPHPATFRARLDSVVRAFNESVIDILVADFTGFRSDVTRGQSRRSLPSRGGHAGRDQKENR